MVEGMKARMADVEERSNSTTMCTAKWLQSTVYLMNGHTHSCHHPSAHVIPIHEIKRNPKALHNTEFKMQRRLEMLDGQRPKECQYCWNVEDLPGNHMSDRTYKSTMSWSYPNLQKVLDSQEGRDINPTYLEVAFDNACNLKCMYCSPDISSKWMEEVERHGPYQGTTYNIGNIEWLKKINKFPIPVREENPYVDAFWKWWPELYRDLHTFRITGGEPLMSKNTWKILSEVRETPRSDFTLGLNTNLMVPDKLIDQFIGFYNDIAPNIKEFQVHTSAEAHGSQADYIRTGMEYGKFMANCRKFLQETTDSRLNFMITFNILSLTTFKEFLQDIMALRNEFNTSEEFNRVPIMINYLRWPQFQDARIAPQDVKDKYRAVIREYVMSHTQPIGDTKGMFYLEEVDQMERLFEYMDEPLDKDYLATQYNDFSVFYEEYDKRRSVSFDKEFPDLVPFRDMTRQYRK